MNNLKIIGIVFSIFFLSPILVFGQSLGFAFFGEMPSHFINSHNHKIAFGGFIFGNVKVKTQEETTSRKIFILFETNDDIRDLDNFFDKPESWATGTALGSKLGSEKKFLRLGGGFVYKLTDQFSPYIGLTYVNFPTYQQYNTGDQTVVSSDDFWIRLESKHSVGLVSGGIIRINKMFRTIIGFSTNPSGFILGLGMVVFGS
tara:strand:+ start:14172 stop:14777 length:606 start_codon:yes stop_codon:yes gene_type:complete